MNLKDRIELCSEIGAELKKCAVETKEDLFARAKGANGWFSSEAIKMSLSNWALALDKAQLKRWTEAYPKLQEPSSPTSVGIIMAGNIPLVGLHDLISVFISGNTANVKMSSDDSVLMGWVVSRFHELEPKSKDYIQVVDRLQSIDAVIATGSNNTSRYFEAYFGKYPNVIRKNRTSVAVLKGKETREELKKLGADIFSFYGLGCRNVTKLYVPENYDFNMFFESIIDFGSVLNNIKYTHNYDYHKTLFLLNSEQLLDNEFVLVKKDTKLKSPIGVIHYENYSTNREGLLNELRANNEVQCVVDNEELPFGEAQSPKLWDYADGVDTLTFLLNL